MGARALAEQPARDHGRQPVRHPGPGARGVPDRPGRLAGDGLPRAAVLGGELRPRPGRADGRADRRDACARSASTRAWRRCSTSSATCAGAASRRPSARTRSWSARSAAPTCAGLQSAGVDRHAQALRRLLGLAGRPQPRAGLRSGPRELADVLLPPFEMALRAGARSVMNSYTDIDGVPVAADRELLTDLLREHLRLHRHRGRRLLRGRVPADACTTSPATTADGRRAGPGGRHRRRAAHRRTATASRCWPPSTPARSTRRWSTGPLDRVLRQKCELGLLDPDWDPTRRRRRPTVDLDGAESRALARELAARSVVLLANDGTLPLRAGRAGRRGRPARRHDASAMLGCYSFPMHVGAHHPDVPMGVEVADAARRAAPRRRLRRRRTPQGCPVLGGDDDGHRRRRVAAAGTPTSASWCSATRPGCSAAAPPARAATSADLRLPGRQEELLEARARDRHPGGAGAAGRAALRPLAGRPTGWPRVVCGFFPGEEGGPAVADVLTGRVEPVGPAAGQLPRRRLAASPSTYLAAAAGPAQRGQQRRPDAAVPVRPRAVLRAPSTWARRRRATAAALADRRVAASSRVDAAQHRATATASEVVQVYLHDPVAEVARPVQQLVGARPGRPRRPAQARTVTFALHADLDVVHRPRGRADRRARDGRAAGRVPPARTSGRA